MRDGLGRYYLFQYQSQCLLFLSGFYDYNKEDIMKSFYGTFAVALVVSVVFFLLFDAGLMKLQGLSLIYHK